MSLAWVLDRPAMVLPDDPPTVLGELARATGARPGRLRRAWPYPDVLLDPWRHVPRGPPERMGTLTTPPGCSTSTRGARHHEPTPGPAAGQPLYSRHDGQRDQGRSTHGRRRSERSSGRHGRRDRSDAGRGAGAGADPAREELHDGPAQTLSNAVFRVRIVERAMRSDPARAIAELADLRLGPGARDRTAARLHPPAAAVPAGTGRPRVRCSTSRQADRGRHGHRGRRGPRRTRGRRSTRRPHRRAAGRPGGAPERAQARRRPARPCRDPARAADTPDQPGWWSPGGPGRRRGFAVDEASPSMAGRRHFGLRFMRERAQHVGGGLEIVSEAAAGTTVRLRLHPLERSRTTW